MSDPLRTVKVFKYEKPAGETRRIKSPDGNAWFHQFGINYEEFENGPGNFTTAVIERADGRIENVPCDMIQFAEVTP